MIFETIIVGIVNAILTGFGVAIGSYIATNHLIEKIEKKEKE
jgi:hypothetical protein